MCIRDREEAITLSDRMAVFMAGEVRQVGTPAEIFAAPASIEIAAFIGSPPMNLLPASCADGLVTLGGAKFRTSSGAAGTRDVVVGIRPGALRRSRDGISGTVELIESLGETAIVDLSCSAGRLRMRTDMDDVPAEGETLVVSARPQDIHLFDAQTGQRL